MSEKYGKDYLYLIWKDPESRRNFTVGALTKNGGYEFQYGFEIEKAMGEGFQLLTSFNDINRKYMSSILFPAFSSRLPDRKRRDIKMILSKYGLEQYDEYNLLKKSGARLPIDTIELIDPIFEDEEIIDRFFFIAGPKYYLGCEGELCDKAISLEVGQPVELIEEPDNAVDPDAIKVLDLQGNHLGYVPRYYNKSIKSSMARGISFACTVAEFNKNTTCNECIKVHLTSVL